MLSGVLFLTLGALLLDSDQRSILTSWQTLETFWNSRLDLSMHHVLMLVRELGLYKCLYFYEYITISFALSRKWCLLLSHLPWSLPWFSYCRILNEVYYIEFLALSQLHFSQVIYWKYLQHSRASTAQLYGGAVNLAMLLYFVSKGHYSPYASSLISILYY